MAKVNERGVSTSGEEGSTPNDPSKSEQDKKARIRDNQRRSRARRQEHILDLEKRLAECHTTLREAGLQRNAFRELQYENTRLRELLRFAGVNEVLTDSYVNQGIFQSTDPSTSLRQIRPRIIMQQEEARRLQARDTSLYSNTSLGEHLPSAFEPASTHAPPAPYLDAQNISAVQQMHLPSGVPVQRSSHQQKPVSQSSPQPDGIFRCDTFDCVPAGPLLENNDNTILCSVAKEILEHYNVDPLDMEVIKARLATGFAQPAMPGQGCRVDNRLLFQILNDISSRYS